MKVYCEDGAFTKALRELQTEGRITLVSFPYENRNRRIRQRASPSKITADSTFSTADDTTTRISDCESDMFVPIRDIVGGQNEFDIRHIDSAYKTGCRYFFTRDKTDILRWRSELHSLLGITFLHPDEDLSEFLRLLNNELNA
jgi:hypothetical protein